MQRMWIVEDVPKDIRVAGAVLTSMGVSEIEVRRDVKKAIQDLEGMLERSSPLPDGIVLDLNFGGESGFELLRLWHSTPKFKTKTDIVVWTEMSDSHQRLCQAFGVRAVVPKWEGPAALEKALKTRLQQSPASLPAIESLMAMSPGEAAVQSGIYAVLHARKRCRGKEVAIIRGTRFLKCRTCGDAVRYQLLFAAPALSEDEDFR